MESVRGAKRMLSSWIVAPHYFAGKSGYSYTSSDLFLETEVAGLQTSSSAVVRISGPYVFAQHNSNRNARKTERVKIEMS